MDSFLLLSQAIEAYTAHGWSIIPIRSGDKRPLVRWEEFQYRRPRAEEVHAWFSGWPDAGMGVVTGAVSGLVVLDIDPEHGGEASLERLQSQHFRLPTTVECRSGGGGRHLYFAHPGAFVRNKAGLAPGVDLRGDGGYVVAPPSLHASGLRYAWVGDRRPKTSDLARCRAGCAGWRSTDLVDSGIRSPIGVGSSGRAFARVNVTTRSLP